MFCVHQLSLDLVAAARCRFGSIPPLVVFCVYFEKQLTKHRFFGAVNLLESMLPLPAGWRSLQLGSCQLLSKELAGPPTFMSAANLRAVLLNLPFCGSIFASEWSVFVCSSSLVRLCAWFSFLLAPSVEQGDVKPASTRPSSGLVQVSGNAWKLRAKGYKGRLNAPMLRTWRQVRWGLTLACASRVVLCACATAGTFPVGCGCLAC